MELLERADVVPGEGEYAAKVRDIVGGRLGLIGGGGEMEPSVLDLGHFQETKRKLIGDECTPREGGTASPRSVGRIRPQRVIEGKKSYSLCH